MASFSARRARERIIFKKKLSKTDFLFRFCFLDGGSVKDKLLKNELKRVLYKLVLVTY